MHFSSKLRGALLAAVLAIGIPASANDLYFTGAKYSLDGGSSWNQLVEGNSTLFDEFSPVDGRVKFMIELLNLGSSVIDSADLYIEFDGVNQDLVQPLRQETVGLSNIGVGASSYEFDRRFYTDLFDGWMHVEVLGNDYGYIEDGDDPQTGEGYKDFQMRITPTDIVPDPVPEPGEWAAMGILGAGLTGLVVRARRRR